MRDEGLGRVMVTPVLRGMNHPWIVGSAKESRGHREEASCRGQRNAVPPWMVHTCPCTWPQRWDEGLWGAAGGRRAFLENPGGVVGQQQSSLNPHTNAGDRSTHAPPLAAVGAQPHPGAPPPEVPACWWWCGGWGTHEHTSRVLLMSVC